MATSVQQAAGHATTFEPVEVKVASGPVKHDVPTSLNYYKEAEDGSPPKPSYVGRPETYERPTAPLDVTVHDIAGEVEKYTLDGNGFEIFTRESKEKDFVDDDKIRAEYYPEVEQLLKDATGASRIFIFDHTIRREEKDKRDSVGAPLRGPVNRVHIDQSYTAARSRVPFHLPEDSDKLLTTRHQIINVWRPIKRILRDPLAVADGNTVPDADLVPVGLIYPNRKGETLTVRPNTQHKWYYLYGQTPEQTMLIKCFDSKLDGRVRRVPHTAFSNPETVDEEPRESIEVRALVFHEDQSAE